MKSTAELITDLPRPIALLLLRCVDEVTDSGKSTVDLFEVLTRYLSAVTVSLYCTTKGSADLDRTCLAAEASTGLGKGCERLLAAAKGLRRSGDTEYRPFWEWREASKDDPAAKQLHSSPIRGFSAHFKHCRIDRGD